MTWELTDDRPIYLQIIEQVKLRIVSGLYPAGSKLPSVRDMAADAAVNPNTMQRALSDLEREGLIYSERTSGRFVTDSADMITNVKRTLADGLISEFMEKMRTVGYSAQQTIEAIQTSIRGEQ